MQGKFKYPVHPREDLARRFSNVLEAERIEFVWFPSATWIPTDCPFVATVWDLQHRLQPVFPEVGAIASWEGREKLFSRYLQRAAIVLAGSERCKEEVSLFYQVPSERIEVIPYPTTRFALAGRSSEASEDRVVQLGITKPYFLYPAQFWPHKNHVNLLLALDLLRRQRDFRPHLVLVGSDQGNEPYVRQWVDRLGLTEQVHLPGFVPEETLAALYRDALALTFVSFFGPDNLPPLEAFALGCPVIASEVPGARDQYGDAVAYVDPADVEGIAAAMAVMHESPETRAQFAAKGDGRAGAWTATNYHERLFAIFDRLEAVRRSWGERW